MSLNPLNLQTKYVHSTFLSAAVRRKSAKKEINTADAVSEDNVDLSSQRFLLSQISKQANFDINQLLRIVILLVNQCYEHQKYFTDVFLIYSIQWF